MAEVHGNRTHLRTFDPYTGFEDQEAHQNPGTSVGIIYYFTWTNVNAQMRDWQWFCFCSFRHTSGVSHSVLQLWCPLKPS